MVRGFLPLRAKNPSLFLFLNFSRQMSRSCLLRIFSRWGLMAMRRGLARSDGTRSSSRLCLQTARSLYSDSCSTPMLDNFPSVPTNHHVTSRNRPRCMLRDVHSIWLLWCQWLRTGCSPCFLCSPVGFCVGRRTWRTQFLLGSACCMFVPRGIGGRRSWFKRYLPLTPDDVISLLEGARLFAIMCCVTEFRVVSTNVEGV